MLYVRTVPIKMNFLLPENIAMIASFWIYMGEIEFNQIFIKKCKKLQGYNKIHSSHKKFFIYHHHTLIAFSSASLYPHHTSDPMHFVID